MYVIFLTPNLVVDHQRLQNAPEEVAEFVDLEAQASVWFNHADIDGCDAQQTPRCGWGLTLRCGCGQGMVSVDEPAAMA